MGPAHSGTLNSEAPALARPALGSLGLSHFPPQSMSVHFFPAQALQRLQIGILFHVGF